MQNKIKQDRDEKKDFEVKKEVQEFKIEEQVLSEAMESVKSDIASTCESLNISPCKFIKILFSCVEKSL